jgi:ElaB/YqjD/DUF883 family membrane-anchored ribosome-binding protein
MFGSPYSSSIASNVSAIEQRLRQLEGQLERIGRTGGRRASASLSEATDQVAIASALSEMLDRLRTGGRRVGKDAMRFGNDAAGFGNDALDRLSTEVEHRPLMTLAVAVGVGILIGMAGRRS